MKLSGGCHCGQVRYELEVPAEPVISQCNCSVCAKSGYLGLIVPKAQFKLLAGEDMLSTYTFNTGIAQHHFCRHCGIKSFYVPRSHPDGVSVNFRCVDESHGVKTTLSKFDGQEWEKQLPDGRADGFPNML